MKSYSGGLKWLLSAACLEEDPELFFPTSRSREGAEQAAVARAVCGTCRVREPCLQLALETNSQFGIWAGFTPLELSRIRRRRVRAR